MRTIALCTLVFAVACGGAGAGKAPPNAAAGGEPAAIAPTGTASSSAASFRDKAPEPGKLAAPVFPKADARKLPNGIQLIIYEMHDVPVVRMTMVGFSSRSAVSTVRWRLAERATAKHSVEALASAWQSLGAEHGALIGDDAAGLSVKVMAKDFETASTLLLEEWMEPTRDEKELSRLKLELVEGVKSERSDLASVARNLVRVPLERYMRSESGTEESLASVSLSAVLEDAKCLKLDVVSQPKLTSTACPTVAFVAGDIRADDVSKRLSRLSCPKLQGGTGGGYGSERHGGGWRMGARKGATQAHVYLASYGVPFSTDEDRAAFWVMNEILGGSFSSRINMNLREKNAFTYGAYSRYRPFSSHGLWSVGGPMKADKAGEAFAEIRVEIERIRTQAVGDEELRRAKDSWLRTLPARYETADDVVGAWLQDWVLLDRSDEQNTFDSHSSRFSKQIEAVTKEQVMESAKKYLAPARLDLVTVGDPDLIAAEFAPFKLGTPVAYDELGMPLKAK